MTNGIIEDTLYECIDRRKPKNVNERNQLEFSRPPSLSIKAVNIKNSANNFNKFHLIRQQNNHLQAIIQMYMLKNIFYHNVDILFLYRKHSVSISTYSSFSCRYLKGVFGSETIHINALCSWKLGISLKIISFLFAEYDLFMK